MKAENDGTLTFRRSCAHGICGSDAMLINGRNRLACKIRVDQLGTKITVAPLTGLPVVKDLVVDMEGFFAKYRSVMPFLVTDSPPPERERLQSQADRARYDDTTKCILCAACTTSCPSFWAQPVVRRPGRDRERPPLHLRQPRRRRRGAARDPRRQGRRLALPDDLQLRRRLPARHQHHPRDPRGLAGGRGALDLSGGGPRRLIIRTDGAARGNPGPASAGAVLIDADAPGAERPDAPPIATISEALGRQTNNVAEWTGLLRALDLAEELGAEEVALLLDSLLIVEQLRGRWRVKDAKLAPLHAEATARLARFRRWSARHVPRSENHAADALANEALDRVAAGGPAVVVRRPGEGIRSEAGTRLSDAPGDAADGPAGDGAPRPRRPAARNQLALGLEPGFDPGDPGPEAGRAPGADPRLGHEPGDPAHRLRLRDLHVGRPARPAPARVGPARLGGAAGDHRLRPGLPGAGARRRPATGSTRSS